MELLQNRPFDELKIGDTAELTKVLTEKEIQLFAVISGDINPAHLDANYAQTDRFHHIVGHGMWSASLISAVLGTLLPGPGTIYLDQHIHFCRPVAIHDTVTIKVVVKAKNSENKNVTLDCQGINQQGVVVLSGEAVVIAPTEKISCPRAILPEVNLQYQDSIFKSFMTRAEKIPAIRTAIVHPVTVEALQGAIDAAEKKYIEPVLVGPLAKIKTVAKLLNISLESYECIDVPHSHAAADIAVTLVRNAKVAMLMKGSLHTDELLHAVLDKAQGIRTERRLSHIFVMNVPTYPRPLFITDAAINIQPTIEAKRDIVQNAIDLALALGINQPKVALLSAIETINPNIQSTLDAAALCKMADRGQITGGILDGPLAFDNAISEQAAFIKNIQSPVAGKADILVVPDLISGNMLAKQLTYLAHAHAAGVVLGAKVPIILTSRADSAEERLLSTAVAVLYAAHQNKIGG